ncbi:MAG: (2Fe-2S)-binding protein [Candidatus Aminicenantes bacterium]|jgi:carbon-monoxide dehydrogenase small subunit
MEINMVYEINFTLNGEQRKIAVRPNETLLNVLRYKLGITSTKSGCEEGSCGTCTVKLNDLIVKSCLILAVEVDGQVITTVEGLMTDGLTPLQKTFLKHNSFQCGYCAPGMVMAAEALLESNPNPTDEEIKEGLAGNLCRCTGYLPIIEAVKDHVKSGGNHE